MPPGAGSTAVDIAVQSCLFGMYPRRCTRASQLPRPIGLI